VIFHPVEGVGRKSILGDDVFIKRVVAVEGDSVEVRPRQGGRGPVGRGLRPQRAGGRAFEAGGVGAATRQPAGVWAAGRAAPRARAPAALTNPTCAPGPPQVKGGKLYVNGVPRVEPFINEAPAYTLSKLVVPPGDVSGRARTAAPAPAPPQRSAPRHASSRAPARALARRARRQLLIPSPPPPPTTPPTPPAPRSL
jgi:hypothetical protein